MNKGTLQLDERVLQKLNALAQTTDQTPEEFICAIANELAGGQAEDDTLLV